MLTFIHIPKTAGISITQWLEKNFKEPIARNGTGYVHPSLPMLLNAKVATEETFAVVRNPWDRIVSLWSFWSKFEGNQNITFDTFVKNLKSYKLEESSWFTFATPQKAWIPDGVTYLLRFETLENDFKVIQKKLGCSEPLPHINNSIRDDYHKYYTDETRAIIAQVFKDDIDSYGFNYI